jgi:hypothetical protein
MSSRMWIAAAGIGVFGLIAAACGGTDDIADQINEQLQDNADQSGDPDVPQDLGDVQDQVQDGLDQLDDIGGQLGDCLAIAAAYGVLFTDAFLPGASGLEDSVNDFKDRLPSELHDDVDTIAAAFATIDDQGILAAGDALDTDEFNNANDAITQYLEVECQSLDPGN